MYAMNTGKRTYIDKFTLSKGILNPLEIFLVVKSQDQIERRERMTHQLKQGKIGRVAPRPISEGLLLKYPFPPKNNSLLNIKKAHLVVPFPEPRHIFPFTKDKYFLTEIGCVDLIDSQGKILDKIIHPFFAFLHTVVLNRSQNRILVTSPGYDAIIEIDIKTKQETWSWFGWDHGFNPTKDDVYYANTAKKAEQLKKKGYKAKYINPDEYNEQGLLTAHRTTSPNVAIYNPYNSEATVIVSIGSGKIIEIDRKTLNHKIVFDELSHMPHGIMPFDQGWVVTDTLKGEFLILDKAFNILQKLVLSNLPGKPKGTEKLEWLQLVKPVSKTKFIGLDSNRGIVVFDIADQCYEIIKPDPNWCIQDLLICPLSQKNT